MGYIAAVISASIFLWIAFYVTSNGLDLRDKFSLMFGAVGFLCGFAFALGLLIEQGGLSALNQLTTALTTGLIFGFVILFRGVVTRFRQRKAGIRDKRIKTLYSQLKKKK